MELELAITSYQRLSPAVISTRRFAPGQVWVIGRSESCDWHLPDPGKVVSSRHAEIRCDGSGRFLIRDTSTNGVFINDSPDPLGRDAESPLDNGDRLRVGDYELSVSLVGAESPVDSKHQPAAPEPSVSSSPPPVASAMSAPDPEPIPQGQGSSDINSMLASGLNERFLGDSHVEMPKSEIPDQWDWGSVTGPEQDTERAAKQQAGQLQALMEGLGLRGMDAESLTPDQCRALGDLTRTLLDRLLDLLHMRARQKQQLRVKQTLFQRSENNPLKFSATSSDALESLLFRRHPSFLGPEEAVSQAFGDVVSHERALLQGVEDVIRDILQPPSGEEDGGLLRKRKALAAMHERRQQHLQEYGDVDRMLRSDTFVDAYEVAVSRSERE
ncbi:type VI secretion system-associated FHA domain protein TagH [Marinobacter zhanjiangensis]|uniref:FHA domain-containing protein n=1 Tax=Marinobacter zhanjiangensis TaxID=578215 RepID=A0ABQ3AZW4_9GAMM|nr:type VI secretion system-associated FHA domain protein TagH [Marinobacter zhanjiangensis]GGY71945.1 FHA domain-containing protein [Marinobacter zhanjiangensis]